MRYFDQTSCQFRDEIKGIKRTHPSTALQGLKFRNPARPHEYSCGRLFIPDFVINEESVPHDVGGA